jgi:protein-S-isoprenylcysteine O-methyltransferase Ste14
MPRPYWEIISLCWVVFLVYWSVSTRFTHSPKRQAPMAFTVLNTLLLDAGFVMVLLGRIDVGWLDLRFAPPTAWVQVGGTVLVVAGVALAIWSRRVLGSNWSGAVRILEGQRLVRRGPYAFVRNPIYSGIVLAVLGSSLMRGTAGSLVGVALVVAALWQKGRMEERFLVAEFGEEYAAYQREVKFLIPFIV